MIMNITKFNGEWLIMSEQVAKYEVITQYVKIQENTATLYILQINYTMWPNYLTFKYGNNLLIIKVRIGTFSILAHKYTDNTSCLIISTTKELNNGPQLLVTWFLVNDKSHRQRGYGAAAPPKFEGAL